MGKCYYPSFTSKCMLSFERNGTFRIRIYLFNYYSLVFEYKPSTTPLVLLYTICLCYLLLLFQQSQRGIKRNPTFIPNDNSEKKWRIEENWAQQIEATFPYSICGTEKPCCRVQMKLNCFFFSFFATKYVTLFTVQWIRRFFHQ